MLRLVVLHERRNYEAWRLVEVYNHPEPAFRVEVATIEPLAPWRWILLAAIGSVDRVEDSRRVIEQLRSTSGQMASGALIEYARLPSGSVVSCDLPVIVQSVRIASGVPMRRSPYA
jgi:hypothetical protein